MPLTNEQKTRVQQHLQRFLRECPVCGGLAWSWETEQLNFLGVFDMDYKQPLAGKILPLVSATCKNCYYVAQFSAMNLGLL
jgi:hypothetical protein